MKKRLLLLLLGACLVGGLSADMREFEVINGLEKEIYYLYIAPEGSSEWGIDRLGDDILEAGASVFSDLSMDGDGLFRLLAEDVDGEVYLIRDFDPAATGTISVTPESYMPPGGNNPVTRTLTMYNEIGEDIYYVYISSESTMHWGSDVLGDDIFYEDNSYTIEFPVDGDFPVSDIRAESVNGGVYEKFDVNLLDVSEIVFTQEDETTPPSVVDEEDYGDYSDSYGSAGQEEINEAYLEGYRKGYTEAWAEAYKEGFQAAMEGHSH